MIRIRTLRRFARSDYVRLVPGYLSHARYEVRRTDGRNRVAFVLRRRSLRAPFRKEFPHPAAELDRYRKALGFGWSLGAYDGTSLVGIVLAAPRAWNRSVWVLEVGVAPTHRRMGIGRRLFESLSEHARREGYRTIVCETQTTNVPAIDFYRSLGFSMEGLDVSYYTNRDLERGEVAIFMKKRIRRRAPSRAGPRAGRHTSE